MWPRKSRGHKFGVSVPAERTAPDGRVFDSKAEMTRYACLLNFQRAGLIADLELQPKFPLELADGRPILIRSKGYPAGRRASYRADFRYRVLRPWHQGQHVGQVVVEDVKGMDTPDSRLKRAIVEARYGVRIELVKRRG